jgi:heme a synthase
MPRFAKFSLFVLIWTLCVILWGAFVRATGSGAGCGNHWPTCNGAIIPQPKQIETFIEFIHRLLSGGDLILIFAMVFWGWKISSKGMSIRKSLVASGTFIVIEALLGASLVLFGWVTTNQSVTRAAMMALHLLNTFLLLGAITLTFWFAQGGQPLRLSKQGPLPWLLLIGLAGIALIGMTGAVTALGDTLFPPQSLANGLQQDIDLSASYLVRLRVVHPFIAVLVGSYILFLVFYLLRHKKNQAALKLRYILAALIFLQWTAGIINVILLAPIPMQIIHLFIADMVWITLVLLSAAVLAIRPSSSDHQFAFEVL